MTSAFSSVDSAAIERTVDCAADGGSAEPLQLTDIWTEDRLTECSGWINDHGFRAICLQFPDELLPFSAQIAHELKSECCKRQATAVSDGATIEVYILGDTSYGSCCVDEVAASHINADAIIHFGHACLSRVVRLPLLYVFHNRKLDADRFVQAVHQLATQTKRVFVFYDVGYYYQLDALKNALTAAGHSNIAFAQLAINTEADHLCWTIAKNADYMLNMPCVFIGLDNQTLFNLTLTLSVLVKRWLHYDPSTGQLQAKTPETTAWMRRRRYYIERCKDAQAMGIVVGTLATRGYLDIVRHLQALARHRNVRTYLISVGKVNPSKLANFMEIDCFVLIGCAENDLFTSRDFYKPLLSVYEVEMALNPSWDSDYQASQYSLSFSDVLPAGRLYRSYDGVAVQESDVSLVTGRVRNAAVETETTGDEDSVGEASQSLLLKRNHQLVGVQAGGSLQNRTWTGLDAALGRTEAVRIEAGRSGIAMQYEENVHE